MIEAAYKEPWWTEDIAKAVQEKMKWHKIWKVSRSAEDRITYNQTRRNVKTVKRAATMGHSAEDRINFNQKKKNVKTVLKAATMGQSAYILVYWSS